MTEAGRNPASEAGAARVAGAAGVDTTIDVGDGPADEGDPPTADDAAAEVGAAEVAGAADETGAVPLGAA